MSHEDRRYSEAERAAVYRVIAERRDMRHFVLCLGHVEAFYPAPMLELEGWTQGRRLEDMVFSDAWGTTA